MIPHQDVADLARRYTDAVYDLRDALAERERLVVKHKATGIRPTAEYSTIADRIKSGTDLVATLRAALTAVTGGTP